MHHLFCFNDCLPPVNLTIFTEGLSLTLREFNALFLKGIGIEKAIVTDRLPSEILYADSVTLQDVLDGINDYDLKKFAHAVFYKYPIGNYFDDNDSELLQYNYTLIIDNKHYNALNIAVIEKNGGYLFTPNVHSDVCKNPLEVSIENGSLINVQNLYGEKVNTNDIEAYIKEVNTQNANAFDKLLSILGNCVYSKNFERSFKSLLPTLQKSILERFMHAIDRKLKSPLYPDNDIVKDVTPDKPKTKVYELRVRNEDEIRVYFHESNGRVYLSSLGFKKNKTQNTDIRNAHTIIYRLKVST